MMYVITLKKEVRVMDSTAKSTQDSTTQASKVHAMISIAKNDELGCFEFTLRLGEDEEKLKEFGKALSVTENAEHVVVFSELVFKDVEVKSITGSMVDVFLQPIHRINQPG